LLLSNRIGLFFEQTKLLIKLGCPLCSGEPASLTL
jgi:hypothetical protein